jgi:Domain of unknown function (DUF1918)
MIGNVGDTIVIESERADATGRGGVIKDVFQEQPSRYQVRWEDGHTSILAPSGGSAHIEPKRRAASGKPGKKPGAKAKA